jgi:hypothetical protein
VQELGVGGIGDGVDLQSRHVGLRHVQFRHGRILPDVDLGHSRSSIGWNVARGAAYDEGG